MKILFAKCNAVAAIAVVFLQIALLGASTPVAALPLCSSQIYDEDRDGYGWENEESCIRRNRSEVVVFTPPVGVTFPVCIFQLSDADNDGYGWEDSTTCIITADSIPAPTFINEETGQPVELTRTYWDGNSDIANRTIQCDLHYFNETDRRYKIVEEFYSHFDDGVGWDEATFPSTQFYHRSIPSTPPYLAWTSNLTRLAFPNSRDAANGPPHWTVEDGLYTGKTMLQAPYVEVVELLDGAKAIRRWVRKDGGTALAWYRSGERIRDNGYYECRDISGADFIPTGSPGSPSQTQHFKSDITLTVAAETDPPGQIFNLETAMPVSLERAYWKFNEDIAGKTFSCSDSRWRNDRYGPGGGRSNENFVFGHHFQDIDDAVYYHRSFEGIQEQGEIDIVNGQHLDPVGFLFNSEYIERTETGVRFWVSSEYYTSCSVAPTGTGADIQQENPQSDLNEDADQSGGGEQNNDNANSTETNNQPDDGESGTVNANDTLTLSSENEDGDQSGSGEQNNDNANSTETNNQPDDGESGTVNANDTLTLSSGSESGGGSISVLLLIFCSGIGASRLRRRQSVCPPDL